MALNQLRVAAALLLVLAYLAHPAHWSATPHAKFARGGLYFPLQKAIGTEAFGKLDV
jgi:hypothetical protein